MTERETNWQASWIWGGDEDSPRNAWRCFKRSFELQDGGIKEAEIAITADSRYILYVNGKQCGRGPIRSWPAEQSYHVHDVGHLLQEGENAIAVLVMHYGVSTFQYLRGQGGLLAQLEVEKADGAKLVIGTDEGWLTARHGGYDRRSQRMSTQLGFSESVDARGWDESWTRGTCASGFDRWERASLLGKPGIDHWEWASLVGKPSDEPWTSLRKSPIPALTEELVWPVRVESLKETRPVSWTAAIDIRNAMDPGSAGHANPVSFIGYVAVIVRASEEAEATIGILSRFNALKGISLRGEYRATVEMEGELPERYARVLLSQGDNLLWLDFAGSDHGTGLHFGIDCEAAIKLVSPLSESEIMNADANTDSNTEASPFVLIGPFATYESIDHRDEVHLLAGYEGFGGSRTIDGEAFEHFDAYRSFRSISSPEQLEGYSPWAKPISRALVSRDSVFARSIWKREEKSLPVPLKLQTVCMASAEPAVIVPREGSGMELILDFGKEWSGYLRFEADAPAGTTFDFYGYEYMKDGWRQDTYILDNTLRYVCKEGRQSYESPVRRGLRYLMVTVSGATRPVRLYGVQILQSNYPVAEIGRFHSSDPLLNDIWEISKHTTRLCMEDTFVDCPAYEQAFWVGDSRNEALVNYYVFGETDMVKHCLELVPGSRFQTPLYADQVPSGWSSVIPNWTFFWAIACLEFAEHTGDKAFAKEIWPKVRFTLEHYLEKLDERGLLFIRGWNLLDWAPIDQPRNGVVTHQNAIFARTLKAAARLAEAAGTGEEGAVFTAAGDALAAAINEHLWDDERQAYIDCIHADGRRSKTFSIQTQVIAFLNGIAEGGRKRCIAGYLEHPPKDFVQIGSPFMAFFYYEALEELGRYDLMLDDIRGNFGQMIEHEATTCWEMYPDSAVNRPNPKMLTRSHCHAWSAAPGYFLGTSVLGVRQASSGWASVRVAPQPGDLTWARGAVPLPGGGRIDVSWRLTEADGRREFELEVRAPEAIQVEMVAPEGFEAGARMRRVNAG
ncbi:family 78 glycoside hydrolase catalytic domain [Paenibacillus sp. HB172176]|uniref:family 78 glycoside hydrolase catalytic domain n=1 Tax=Paenibacillus sp. HB172176 TaxID=2493690 RepID=UPI001439989E|nr:family 78 glycoside hydrolase catalytic domain [Paenibacillus sp. HB172176]